MTKDPYKISKQKKIWQIQETKAKFFQFVEDQSKGSFLNFFKAAPYQHIELDIQQRLQDLSRKLDL